MMATVSVTESTAELLRVYARQIENLSDPDADGDEQELDVFLALSTRDGLANAILDTDEQHELARLDGELRAKQAHIARFLPGPNPPDRSHWWWWLHEE